MGSTDSQDVGLEAAFIERVRNSSLVESACAEDVTGLNHAPKLRQRHYVLLGRERSVSLRRCAVRHAGGIRSANADISNDKAGEKPARRKTKGSCPTLIEAG